MPDEKCLVFFIVLHQLIDRSRESDGVVMTEYVISDFPYYLRQPACAIRVFQELALIEQRYLLRLVELVFPEKNDDQINRV